MTETLYTGTVGNLRNYRAGASEPVKYSFGDTEV